MSPTTRISANDVITGKPVTAVRAIGPVGGHRAVVVRLGARWPSGFYFVRLTGPYSPIVRRVTRLE